MSRLRNSPALLAAMDGLVALGIAVGAVVWANERHIPRDGFAQFMMMRMTLLNASFSIVFVILWKQGLSVLGLYSGDSYGLRSLVVRSTAGCAIMTALLDLYLQARHARGPIGQIVVSFFVVALLYETCRVLVCSHQLSWKMGQRERVIIVGSGRRASKAWRELRMQHHGTKRLLGFVDDRPAALMPPDIADRFIGSVDELPGYLLRHVVDEVIVAAPLRSCYDLAQRAVSIAETAGVRVVCLSDLFTLSRERSLLGRAALFVELAPKDHRRESAETAKRVLDVLGAALGIVLLAPLFIAMGLAIKLRGPGPIFVAQERHGYGRRHFQMFTFRNPADHGRRFPPCKALAELPMLWNVLWGDMSLVGPRPMSMEEVALLGEAQLMRRFRVRPGLTGNWQLAGRPPLSLEQWMALDFSYIEEWSLALDLKILARTVPAMIKRAAI